MSEQLTSEISHAMGAPECLLPHLPYLLQDQSSLNGVGAEIIAVLEEVGFGEAGRLLDLGCGRGDIGIKVAQHFKAELMGVDGHPGFIDEAKQKAEALELTCRYQFVADDLRSFLDTGEIYDAVLMIAVGTVLGGPRETIALLRSVAANGGLVIIDDAFLADGVAPSASYEGYLDLAGTEAAYTHFGDAIVARRIRAPNWCRFNKATLKTMPERAAILADKHPDLKDDLDRYVQVLINEVSIMGGPVVPAIWAIRKQHL